MGTKYLFGIQTREKSLKTRAKRLYFDKMSEILPFSRALKTFLRASEW